jgi:hypothetical protein
MMGGFSKDQWMENSKDRFRFFRDLGWFAGLDIGFQNW